MKPWTKCTGLIAATLTPMTESGQVNYDMIPTYIDHLISNGVTEVFVNGTAGEHANLTTRERNQIADKYIEYGRGKLSRVILHCGGPNLTETKEMAAHAEAIGVDCVACILPTYYVCHKISQIVDYVGEVARACPNTPVMYYNYPDITHCKVPLNEFLEAAQSRIPNLIGAKHTSIDLMDGVLAQHNGRFDIAIGADTHFLAALVMGINSSVGIGYSFYGAPFNRLLKAFREGRIEDARKEQNMVNEFWRLLQRNGDEFNMIAVFKAVMRMIGLDLGQPRAPLQMYGIERQQILRAQLDDLRFFDWIKP